MAKKKYTFIDLFAGCGGLSEGFLETEKFVGLAHVEWETPMVNTLRQRLIDKWNHTEEDAQKRVRKQMNLYMEIGVKRPKNCMQKRTMAMLLSMD